VSLVEVTSKPKGMGIEYKQRYLDGREIWWKWHAPTAPINTTGFIPRDKFNQIIGFKPGCHLRSRHLGKRRSGLRKLTYEEFNELKEAFESNEVDISEGTGSKSKSPGKYGPGGEGLEHKKLKKAIGQDPETLLGEKGLEFFAEEFQFDTNDRIDVLLKDKSGRFVVVEVKLVCDKKELAGPLQCMKYRSMLAYQFGKTTDEIRAVLVAYSIDVVVQEKCKKYQIEQITIEKDGL